MHPSINKDYLGSYSIMSSHASSYAATPNANAEALDPHAGTTEKQLADALSAYF